MGMRSCGYCPTTRPPLFAGYICGDGPEHMHDGGTMHHDHHQDEPPADTSTMHQHEDDEEPTADDSTRQKHEHHEHDEQTTARVTAESNMNSAKMSISFCSLVIPMLFSYMRAIRT